MTEERKNLVFIAPPDDVDAVHEFLETVWAANPEVSEHDRMAFETALVELAANVIQHAAGEGGVTCVLTVNADENGLTASLTDTADAGGIVLVARSMPDELAESGRGIALIQALVDDLRYERIDERNVWSITKSRAAAES
ncbi:ATP-binding protein [Herbiconiux sp. P15]|uniref:ATP-binding protein n=1 Tax=Herbiconiux liukaitaii TaxID=3342799 RepID=UPI0035BA3B84